MDYISTPAYYYCSFFNLFTYSNPEDVVTEEMFC